MNDPTDKNKYHKRAQQSYNEALKQDEGSRLALARNHLMKNDLDSCQHQCVTPLRNKHEAATYHFQQLLEKNPTQYATMDKLVQLSKRAGRLTKAPRFIKLAEQTSPRAALRRACATAKA
jgi:tetratricopeptide repeat protein 21B